VTALDALWLGAPAAHVVADEEDLRARTRERRARGERRRNGRAGR
jgi:hypothetical protein